MHLYKKVSATISIAELTFGSIKVGKKMSFKWIHTVQICVVQEPMYFISLKVAELTNVK